MRNIITNIICSKCRQILPITEETIIKTCLEGIQFLVHVEPCMYCNKDHETQKAVKEIIELIKDEIN